jgi:hypothetical protein
MKCGGLDFCKLGKNPKMLAVWERDHKFGRRSWAALENPEFGGAQATVERKRPQFLPRKTATQRCPKRPKSTEPEKLLRFLAVFAAVAKASA